MRLMLLALAVSLLPAISAAAGGAILAVFANPDGEVCWGTGAMLAMYASQGRADYLGFHQRLLGHTVYSRLAMTAES